MKRYLSKVRALGIEPLGRFWDLRVCAGEESV